MPYASSSRSLLGSCREARWRGKTSGNRSSQFQRMSGRKQNRHAVQHGIRKRHHSARIGRPSYLWRFSADPLTSFDTQPWFSPSQNHSWSLFELVLSGYKTGFPESYSLIGAKIEVLFFVIV